MLGFIISTLAFFLAVDVLNRYLDAQSLARTRSRQWLVMMVATVVAFGVGQLVDTLDGDAALPQKSMADVIQEGDPVQMAKMLAGINH